MPDTNRNALAELAERLRLILDLQMPGTPYYQDRMIFCTPEVVDKSMRIVAELAKADAIYAKDPVTNNCVTLQLNAFSNCRAIADGDVRDAAYRTHPFT